MEDKRDKNKMLVSIFVVWLLISFVGIFICCFWENVNILFINFGQLLVVSGLFVFFFAKQKESIIMIIFGLCFIIIACIRIFCSEEMLEYINTKYVPIFAKTIVLLIGIIMFICRKIYFYIKKKNNTLQLDAICVRIEKFRNYDNNSNRAYDYCSIWEYYLNSTQYIYREYNQRIRDLAQIGDVCKIYVNPQNFKDAYKEESIGTRRMWNLFILGWIMMGIMFFVLVA